MEEFEADILASAATYLVEGQELYEASILLLCSDLTMKYGTVKLFAGENITDVSIVLSGNRAIYEIISDEKHRATIAIKRALVAALGSDYTLTKLSCRSFIDEYDNDWRSKLLNVIEGKIPLNQGVPIQDKPPYTWEYLFFRSPVEIAVAKSLDKNGVLFLPNCGSRLGLPNNREYREAGYSRNKWRYLSYKFCQRS